MALFDILLAISAAAVTSVILLFTLSRDSTDRQAAVMAEWIGTGRNGLELWAAANIDSIHQAFEYAGCSGTNCRATINWTGSWSGIAIHPGGVPLIKDAGYLPSGMNTAGVQQRQLKAALLRRADGGLEGFVFATGAAFTREESWNVARLIGSYGGVVEPDFGAGRAYGQRGSWSLNFASGPWSASCVNLGGITAPCTNPVSRDVVAILAFPK